MWWGRPGLDVFVAVALIASETTDRSLANYTSHPQDDNSFTYSQVIWLSIVIWRCVTSLVLYPYMYMYILSVISIVSYRGYQ